MKELLAKIPLEPPAIDAWQGHPLPPSYRDIDAQEGNAWFLDGGNASILEAPHFSLQKLRVAAVHYPDMLVERRECFALITHSSASTTTPRKAGEGTWMIEGGVTGTTEGTLEDAITKARTLLEHALASELRTRTTDPIVLDGDNPPEGCASLQKSITVLTDKGYPLSAALAKKGPWAATLGDVIAVKLDERSRHVFLAHNTSEELLRTLAYWSNDALFPGYPGGLVLADRLARISKDEQLTLKVQAKARIRDSKQHAQLSGAEASIDSHTILDSM